jgi:AcrR family transcriptional regulator
MATSQLRRTREQELIAATRALFDERGLQDAPIDEIARTVGIARGLVYRVFSSKEELYVLTVTDYLRELDGLLEAAIAPGNEFVDQLERWARTFAGFCQRYPAFLDCALSLMRRPAPELHDMVSESVWFRLGQGIGGCVHHVSQLLADGTAAGVFTVEDPDFTANVLWTQTLGTMHLARSGVGVKQIAPEIPALFTIAPEQVVETCVSSALQVVRAGRPGR